jgi:protein-S-isoprenylcysteine O-methyltransferase Ste14
LSGNDGFSSPGLIQLRITDQGLQTTDCGLIFMAKHGTIVQRFRVPLGFLFAAVFLFFARPTPLTLLIGGLISVFGLLIRAWASGHIRKNQTLAISGPYAYTRNPLYVGSFVMGLGFTIAAGVWWLAILFAVLFLGIYLPVMRVEAKELTEIFGDSFAKYAREVPLFIPRLSKYRDENSSSKKFEMELYWRYREYQAGFGVALALAILALKAYFLN